MRRGLEEGRMEVRRREKEVGFESERDRERKDREESQ